MTICNVVVPECRIVSVEANKPSLPVAILSCDWVKTTIRTYVVSYILEALERRDRHRERNSMRQQRS